MNGGKSVTFLIFELVGNPKPKLGVLAVNFKDFLSFLAVPSSGSVTFLSFKLGKNVQIDLEIPDQK